MLETIALWWCYVTGGLLALCVTIIAAYITVDRAIYASGFAQKALKGHQIMSKVLNGGWALVPCEPTHAMERAYFTAELPEFLTGISSTQRHKRNRMKMEARWRAMVYAAPSFFDNKKT